VRAFVLKLLVFALKLLVVEVLAFVALAMLIVPAIALPLAYRSFRESFHEGPAENR
jgi:hypothetical protein